MGYQQAVQRQQAFGVPGELFDDSPVRTFPFEIVSTDPTQNVIGRAFTVSVTDPSQVQVGNPGGNKVFAGILMGPKQYALYGTLAGSLAPTLVLPNGTEGAFARMGRLIVQIGTACNAGDNVIFDNVTGALETIAPGVALPTGKTNAWATVMPVAQTAAGLVVIEITKTPELSVSA